MSSVVDLERKVPLGHVYPGTYRLPKQQQGRPGYTPDKADVHPKAAVDASAVQANEDAVRD